MEILAELVETERYAKEGDLLLADIEPEQGPACLEWVGKADSAEEVGACQGPMKNCTDTAAKKMAAAHHEDLCTWKDHTLVE